MPCASSGVEVGSSGSISTTQPKRLGSFGSLVSVEAVVELAPGVAVARNAVAPQSAGLRVSARRPCSRSSRWMFSSQREPRAPRRHAAGAVVDHAAHRGPVGSAEVCRARVPGRRPVMSIGVRP